MKQFAAMLTTVALLTSASTNAQTLVITRGGSRASSPAPAENFTGDVRVEVLFEAPRSEQQPQPSSQQQRIAGASGALQQEIAPGLATLTDEALFGDVWRRPELSPRDRGLVTIAALAAMGGNDQLDFLPAPRGGERPALRSPRLRPIWASSWAGPKRPRR